MGEWKSLAFMLFLVVAGAIVAGVARGAEPERQKADATSVPYATSSMQELAVSAGTGEKPQSKVWFHDNRWWAVLPNLTGTKLDGAILTDTNLKGATQ